MFKKSITYTFTYFTVVTVWQLIFKKEINWTGNIILCVIIFLLCLLYNWSTVPYEWKKGRNNKDA